jgi:lipoyl(octanoyl) transferase
MEGVASFEVGGTMGLPHLLSQENETESRALRVYLLGVVDFAQALRFQHALAAQVSAARHSACLILCEHPPLITVGRHGRPADLDALLDEDEPQELPVRWVNRGGGCVPHAPGQFAIYPVVALDAWGLGVEDYLRRLHGVLLDLLDDFGIETQTRPGQPGVWVGRRLIAAVGVAVQDWVAYFGAYLNVHPDLTLFRGVRTTPHSSVAAPEAEAQGLQPRGQGDAATDGPMTSIVRERHAGLRPGLVRERLLEHFHAAFPFFERTALFGGHPLVSEVRRPHRFVRAGED